MYSVRSIHAISQLFNILEIFRADYSLNSDHFYSYQSV